VSHHALLNDGSYLNFACVCVFHASQDYLMTSCLKKKKEKFFFQDRFSLCNPSCPGTHSVDQGRFFFFCFFVF
jgi:hypothetical protein